jgi:hypothetical protein
MPRWRPDRPGLAAIAAVAVIGCSPPRIDPSTDETFEASMVRVRGSVSAGQRGRFDQAVLALGAEQVTLETVAQDVAPNAVSTRLKAALAGKTAEQIIAEAARLQAARDVRARADLQAEIAVLVSRQQRAFAAREALKQFEVGPARIAPGDGRPGSGPMVHLDVRNGTGRAVSRAYFEVVADGTSAAPAARGELAFTARRPLEAGESAVWLVNPASRDVWSTMSAGSALRVAAVRLEGPDGEVLLDAREYTEDDAARLVSLQYQLAMLTP